MPVGWGIPHQVVEQGLLWSPRPLMSYGEARWVNDYILQIKILELHADALTAGGEPLARDVICPADSANWMRVNVLASLGVRNAARTSRASTGVITMQPEACAPGSGPGLYAAGDYTQGALGLAQPARGCGVRRERERRRRSAW